MVHDCVLRFLWGSRSDHLFVSFGPNSDFRKEIMKGKWFFGKRGLRFLCGGPLRFLFVSFGPTCVFHQEIVKKKPTIRAQFDFEALQMALLLVPALALLLPGGLPAVVGDFCCR